MLDYMRRQSNSILMYVLFAGLALVFAVNFGPGGATSCSGATGNYAALVDGQAISYSEYIAVYERQQQMFSQRMRGAGGNFDMSRFDEMIRNQVLDQLINRELLANVGRRRGLAVSDTELEGYLTANFNLAEIEDYRRWVAYNFGLSPEQFEENVRAEMIGQKVANLVQDNVTVSDEQLKETYLRENDRAMVHFVRFDPFSYEVEPPGTAEVEKIIAERKADLEERYNKDVFKYRNPEQRVVRQIFKALPDGASDADVARVRGELMALKEQIDGGADFAALAKTESEDAESKDKGGEIGLVKRGELSRQLDRMIFKLEKGKVSDEPVRTDKGMALLEVTEIKPSTNKKFEEVIKDVAVAVLSEEAQMVSAKEAAESFLAQLKAGGKLAELTVTEAEKREKKDLAPGTNVRIESPWVLASQKSIPRLGTDEKLTKEIFAKKLEEPLVDHVVESNRAFFVVELAKRERPDLAKFEGEKEVLRERALSQKKNTVLTDWLEHLREKAIIELNPQLFPAAAAEETEQAQG
jgi:peptidyl-prolyl cis-trans isomerase D